MADFAPPPYRLFLSHGSADRPVVETIRGQLMQLGIYAYMHEHDGQAGVRVAEKIQKEIEASDGVIALITQNSKASPYVHQEIGFALRAERLIIPLVDPAVASESLAMLQGVEWIPFDIENPSTAVQDLTARLGPLQQRYIMSAANSDIRKARQGTTLAIGICVLVLLAAFLVMARSNSA